MQDKENLIAELKSAFERVREKIYSESFDIENDEDGELWKTMAEKAVELHKIVKPKHHKYMIKNRGCSPDDPEFYNHFHPVEDLLAFIDDPHANDDPEDQTIGHEFYFKVYSRRWGHYDTYKVVRTANGWDISHIPEGARSGKDGSPGLYNCLEHDSINYPEDLPGYMKWLWLQAEEKGLSHDEVQEALNDLAEWVSNCEKSTPRGIFREWK